MAGFAVTVEAVSAVTEILSDDVLTGCSRRTLMPTGRAFVDVCQQHTSRPISSTHRYTESTSSNGSLDNTACDMLGKDQMKQFCSYSIQARIATKGHGNNCYRPQTAFLPQTNLFNKFLLTLNPQVTSGMYKQTKFLLARLAALFCTPTLKMR